jgi:hypothetical protein
MNKKFLKMFFLCLCIPVIIETAQKFWKALKDKIKNKENELKDKEKK